MASRIIRAPPLSIDSPRSRARAAINLAFSFFHVLFLFAARALATTLDTFPPFEVAFGLDFGPFLVIARARVRSLIFPHWRSKHKSYDYKQKMDRCFERGAYYCGPRHYKQIAIAASAGHVFIDENLDSLQSSAI